MTTLKQYQEKVKEQEQVIEELEDELADADTEIEELQEAIRSAAEMLPGEDDEQELADELVGNGIFTDAAKYGVRRVASRGARKKYERQLAKLTVQKERVEEALRNLKDAER